MTRREAIAAIRANPRDVRAWLELGAILAAEGDIARARECYERVLQLDPESDEARAALGLFDKPSASIGEKAPAQKMKSVAAESSPSGSEGMETAPFSTPVASEPDEKAWLHDMRERVAATPPPPLPRARINPVRLTLVILVLLLCAILSCGAILRFRAMTGAEPVAPEATEEATAQAGDGQVGILPAAGGASRAIVATWTLQPSGTYTPPLTASLTRAPLPGAATREARERAIQEYRDIVLGIGPPHAGSLVRNSDPLARAQERSDESLRAR